MTLKTLILAPLALFALAPPLMAQEVAAPVQSNAVPAQPALWKVADHDTTIFLFGTIHLLPEGIAWYAGPVAEAFEEAGELVTEIPEASDGETAGLLIKHGTLLASQSLRAGMTSAERGKYEATLAQLGLPAAAFDRYKPWFAAVVLATLPLQRSGFSTGQGVENQLDARNKQLKRGRTGLETLEFQLSIFDGFSNEVQKRYLFEVIDALPTINQDVARMVDAWAKGDAGGLAALLNAQEDDPAMYEALLTRRNRSWAQWIAKRMEQPGTVFVAVGAGHLGGRDSVQDELAKAGLTAARVQ